MLGCGQEEKEKQPPTSKSTWVDQLPCNYTTTLEPHSGLWDRTIILRSQMRNLRLGELEQLSKGTKLKSIKVKS